jgi:nucleoside-diphosphate-sugar epimerase
VYLVTGANGYIGRALTDELVKCRRPTVVVTRGPQLYADEQRVMANAGAVVSRSVSNIDGKTDWFPVLEGVDTVIHCAAKAHSTSGGGHLDASALHDSNVTGTLRLAAQAATAGVKRFVFLSSIGVNGRNSSQPFTENHVPNPHDSYSRSKLDAERGLFSVCSERGMEAVVLRPPLVYGPQAPGRFRTLVRWATSGLPLPLGAIDNRRSLMALNNLVDLILLCADRVRSPRAANQVFLAADGEDVSTTQLLTKIANAADRPIRLVPMPTGAIRAAAYCLGLRDAVNRILDDLQVDASKSRALLGWRPVINMDDQLAAVFSRRERSI